MPQVREADKALDEADEVGDETLTEPMLLRLSKGQMTDLIRRAGERQMNIGEKVTAQQYARWYLFERDGASA